MPQPPWQQPGANQPQSPPGGPGGAGGGWFAANKIAVIMIVAALVVVVGAVGAGAATNWFGMASSQSHKAAASGPAATTGGSAGGSASSTKSGAAIDVSVPNTPSFAYGYKVAWKATPDSLGVCLGEGAQCSSEGVNMALLAEGKKTWVFQMNLMNAHMVPFGVDRATGALKWKPRPALGSFVSCTRVTADDIMYCANPAKVLGINVNTGATVAESPPLYQENSFGSTKIEALDPEMLAYGGQTVELLGNRVVALYEEGNKTTFTVMDTALRPMWSGQTQDNPTVFPCVRVCPTAPDDEQDGVLIIKGRAYDEDTGKLLSSYPSGSSLVFAGDHRLISLEADINDTFTTSSGASWTVAPLHMADTTRVVLPWYGKTSSSTPLLTATPNGDAYTLSMIDLTGKALSSPTEFGRVDSSESGSGLSAVASDNTVIVSDGFDSFAALEMTDGAVLWKKTLSGTPRANNGNTVVALDLASPSVILVSYLGQTGWTTYAISCTDGKTLWSVDGALGRGRGDVGDDVSAGLIHSTGDSTSERLVPVSASSRVSGMPSGVPSCPAGWAPVGWSSWSGGHTLVCWTVSKPTFYLDYVNGDAHYTTVDAKATATGGYTAAFDSGPTVNVSLGGSLVQAVSGADSQSFTASAAWQDGAKTTLTAPAASVAKIPGCPQGSVPLSLSTWNGGWLLTCGASSAAVTSFAYATGPTAVTGGKMAKKGQGYCGKDGSNNTVCTYPTPSLVTVTPAGGGKAKQYSAGSNYFAGKGAGGSGKGTGAYGVNAPKDTAEDQVRYLQQILDKSAAGRQALNPSVSACDVAGITSVADNRTELLTSLASAPVDKVPGGERLLAELNEALGYSLEADNAYLAWAKGGCQGQTPTPSADALATSTKQTFAADWNSTIVGKYTPATEINPGTL